MLKLEHSYVLVTNTSGGTTLQTSPCHHLLRSVTHLSGDGRTRTYALLVCLWLVAPRLEGPSAEASCFRLINSQVLFQLSYIPRVLAPPKGFPPRRVVRQRTKRVNRRVRKRETPSEEDATGVEPATFSLSD